MANNTVLNPGALGDTIATKDVGGVKHELVIAEFNNGVGGATEVSASSPLPTTDAVAEAALTSIAAEDFATQVTLAAVLAKISSDPATQTTLAAILAKIISSPATEATLASILTKLNASIAVTGTFFQATQPVSNASLPLPSGASTETTLASILAKIITSPATEATLALIKAKTDNLDVALSTRLKPADTLAAVTAIINALPAGTNLLGKIGLDQTTDGTTNKVRATATQKYLIGSTVVLAVTALQSLANSQTVGWKSVRTSNLTTLANDYEIMVSLTTANTAPGNDKAMYIFAIPWYTSDGGTTWFAASGGTTTLPTSADATYTIATPHNFRLLGVLNYTTAQAVVQDVFLLSNCFGNRLPDGFSLCIINYSGAALSTGCIVDITPINDTLV